MGLRAAIAARRKGYVPYRLARHAEAGVLELISFPFQDDEGGPVKVMAREPKNPMTMRAYRLAELCPLTVRPS
jgi:hypothetical protein